MRTREHQLGTIVIPGPDDPLDALYRLRERTPVYWAADTETTGGKQFTSGGRGGQGFAVRLVQVGTRDEAWLLRPEWHGQAIADLTRAAWWHNATYDALALDFSCEVPYADTMAEHQNTAILSRLLDPRPAGPGSLGHKLKDLSEAHIMTGVKDARAVLLAEAKRLFGRSCTADEMWWRLPADNEVYELYAGQDVFLTARLAEKLDPMVAARGLFKLDLFEHQLERRTALMTKRGMAFDIAWAELAEAGYDDDLVKAEHQLVEVWGITPTDSGYAQSAKKSLIERFDSLGARWVKQTAKGAISLDASVLDTFSRLDGDVAELARAVLAAKRAKHYGDYVRAMRDNLGVDGRVHPTINTLAAATARMSITDPALQQLPRGDKLIRGCLIADPGEVILCADYAQVEFRVGAAVSGDEEMRRRILAGEDLHANTATALFGPGFTPEQRNVSKGVGFGRLFMGRPNGIRAGIAASYPENCPPLSAVRRAVTAFDRAYPQTIRWQERLKREVENGNPVLVTATGRPLIVDIPYAAANYAIQSAARDIFAAGLMAMHREGLGDYLRLVVHDEVVLSVPAERAQEIGEAVARCMSRTFRGVPIDTEWTVKGERWSK